MTARHDVLPDSKDYFKISSEYLIREIAGEQIIIPVGRETENFDGLISVNEVARTLWEMLQKGSDFQGLVHGICAEYEVDEETAGRDIRVFLEKLQANGILENS